jgi:hypothetical protein
LRVLRGMRADPADGPPAIGETGRYLGVRPGVDIPVAPDGFVDPGMEGMSVAPTPVEDLPRHPPAAGLRWHGQGSRLRARHRRSPGGTGRQARPGQPGRTTQSLT